MAEQESYEKQYTAAKKRGDAKDTHTVIESWAEVGQIIIGRLVSIEPLRASKFPAPVNQYVIETDKGRVSCILGGATDSLVEGKLTVGDLVRIEYLGKAALADGKRANRFHVAVFGHQAPAQ